MDKIKNKLGKYWHVKCILALLVAFFPLLVGGNIVIGKQKFEDVEKRFKDMGFDRAFPPGTAPETTIEALRELLHMDGENQ